MAKQPYGMLLIHGFSGTPDGFNEVSQKLESMGLPCQLPLLTGHGADTPEALLGINWPAWQADAEKALLDLLTLVEKAIVLGHSMGGWIAINLSIDYREKIDSIIVAGASTRSVSPFGPGGPLHFLYPLIVKMKKKWDWPPVYEDPDLAQYCTAYEWIPTVCFEQVFDFMKVTEKRLPEVTVPILILDSKNDSANSTAGAQMLYNNISTAKEEKELMWFEKTEHDMFVDCEREGVNQAVVEYVKVRI